jgi:hypothetical protein
VEIKLKDEEMEALRTHSQHNKCNLQEIIKNLEAANKLLETKVKDMEKERERFYDTIAVNDMLHESFKERMKDKYKYDSDDTESDYEPDEEIRENNREIKRLKKRDKWRKESKCDICDFIGKSEAGLKTHKTKKHKESI